MTKRAAAVLSVVIVMASCGGTAAPPRSPHEAKPLSWAEARHAARVAHDAKDYAAYRVDLQALYDQSGSVWILESLVGADLLLGDRARAMDGLSRLASMGVALDLESDPDLAPLRTDPGWPALLQRTHANEAPVANARAFAPLPKGDLVTEDIAYDAASKTFFVSSVRHRKILAVDATTGAARDFVAEGAHGISGILGMAMQGTTLWATMAALPLVVGYDARAAKATALLGFDARTGELVERVDLSDDGTPHGLTDMTASADGAVYVSDAAGGAVYTFVRGGHGLERLTAPGELVSPQTPALAADGRTLFVPDYVRGIAAIDLATRAVSWLERADDVALTGIDGLYLDGNAFLAVQNGMAPPRVVRLSLSPTGRRVERADVLERKTPGLGEPTHGVLVDGAFYFLAASGWARFDDDGKPKTGAPPGEPAIWVIDPARW